MTTLTMGQALSIWSTYPPPSDVGPTVSPFTDVIMEVLLNL